jgi:hypothetical protein
MTGLHRAYGRRRQRANRVPTTAESSSPSYRLPAATSQGLGSSQNQLRALGWASRLSRDDGLTQRAAIIFYCVLRRTVFPNSTDRARRQSPPAGRVSKGARPALLDCQRRGAPSRVSRAGWVSNRLTRRELYVAATTIPVATSIVPARAAYAVLASRGALNPL